MNLRVAASALTALAIAGVPALALAQPSNTAAPAPAAAKTTHKASHAKKASHHHKAAPAKAAK